MDPRLWSTPPPWPVADKQDTDAPSNAVAGDRNRITRVAVLADVSRVVALVESAYRGETSRIGWTTEADLLGGQRTDERGVAEMLRDDAARVLLVEQSSSLLACVHLKRLGTSAELGMFAVRPGAQGHGIGSTLLALVETWLFELGVTLMRLHVIRQRPELLAFYARRGYLPTGHHARFPYGDERFGLPKRPDLEFLVLEKLLTAP